MTDKLDEAGRRDPEPRQDLVQRSAPFLPAGHEIRQAFICQSAPNLLFFVVTYLTGLTLFWNKYRCVVVTRDAIYVLDSSKLSGGASPRRLAATMARHTHGSGIWPLGGDEPPRRAPLGSQTLPRPDRCGRP